MWLFLCSRAASFSSMVLSKPHETALTKCRYDFVKSLEPTDTMLSFLRSKLVLTEEMENQVRVNKFPVLNSP